MKRENDWQANVNNPVAAAAAAAAANSWADPRGITRTAGNPNDIRTADPRDARNQPRYHLPMREACDPREMLHGDVRGISGNLKLFFFC